MAELIKARLRVKEIHFADPIKTEAEKASAVWKKMPATLRDDEVLITQAEPEEDPVYSHEEDSPVEVDYTGQGVVATGSFIRATREQLAELLGGTVKTGEYQHSPSILKLEKAIKLTCADDSVVIIPNASGFVTMNMSLGKSGTSKFPFKFNCLKASDTWAVDIVF